MTRTRALLPLAVTACAALIGAGTSAAVPVDGASERALQQPAHAARASP